MTIVRPALPLDVLVVGGGIGGLACALALAQAGRRVHVVEQAPVFAEIGAGLQLGPNATRAFSALGLLETVLRSAVLPPRAVVRDRRLMRAWRLMRGRRGLTSRGSVQQRVARRRHSGRR
jgi:2-polyprenyl-6-methoxyphenol hydroxylase-like FAD-dependent oxidoreductase